MRVHSGTESLCQFELVRLEVPPLESHRIAIYGTVMFVVSQ